MREQIKYAPGTAKSRQETEFSSAAFTDTDHVRFQEDGKLATIPAYSQASHALSGKCRAVYAQRITGTYASDCYFFGTSSHLYVEKNGTVTNITPLSQSSSNLGTDPITITDTESEIQITFTDIGVNNVVGDRIKLASLTTVGNITAAMMNKEHIITEIVDDDNVKVDVGTAATSSTTGGGSTPGTVTYQIAAGNANQGTAAGMGAGDFGGGDFGGGGVSTTGTQSYPRIWSFGPFGDNVVMCPGDRSAGEGQYIYLWDGDTAVAPTKLTNAPTDCNWVMVVNNHIVALRDRTVQISAIGASTTWTGVGTYSKSLERVDVLFSGFVHGEKNAVLHHAAGAVLLRYTGDEDLWDLSDIKTDDAAIAPYACTTLNEFLVWQGERNFYLYDGGVVRTIVNTQNRDWIIRNINPSRIYHSFMCADTEKQEVYAHFPTSSEDNPSDYVNISNFLNGQAYFTLGQMDRTAAQIPGIYQSTFYMADEGSVYRHFTRGTFSASWSAETSFMMADKNVRFMVRELFPDSNQSGDITVEIISKEYPQATEVSHGTWTISASTEVVSVKAAGRLVKFKFSGSTEATFGPWMIDITPLGRRKGLVA